MSSLATPLTELPLFPLHTVLFPDGLLPLKVFEARYLDMTRACLRENSPFGVCLLRSGPEVAQEDHASVPEAVGCMARIIDCDTGEFGMLFLRTIGTTRFRLLSHRVEANGLLVGMTEPLPEDIPLAGDLGLAQFGACAEALERIITVLRRKQADLPLFQEPPRYGDPFWVSNRLSEILPLDQRIKQKLLEMDSVTTRIDAVHQMLDRLGWL